MQVDLVYRLRYRAEIRRQIPPRKSVQEGAPDRIADLLEEAADEIERLKTLLLRKQMKVVINTCFGGFGLSDAAIERFCELDGCSPINFWAGSLERNDPNLVKVVQELGEAAETPYSELKIVDIPAGVKWHIHEYDGLEHVAEDHRIWN